MTNAFLRHQHHAFVDIPFDTGRIDVRRHNVGHAAILDRHAASHDLAGVVPFSNDPAKEPLVHHQQRTDAPLRHQVDGFGHGRIRRDTDRAGALLVEQVAYLLQIAAPECSRVMRWSLAVLPVRRATASVIHDRLTGTALVTVRGTPGQAGELTSRHAERR